jgi:maltose O-acetyltransferase
MIAKTEKEKMLSNELYNSMDHELTIERNLAHEALFIYNQTKESETDKRRQILINLLKDIGDEVIIKSPFYCDYGYNIKLGNKVFINYGCTILDCNLVIIGNNVLIAPHVQIYTAYHPTDPVVRLQYLEYADQVAIGNNVWIGGGAIICNGVSIGDNTTIGAGSVVINNIPSNVVAVGNPCKVIKYLS